jgi:hypothetical protein
MMDRGGYNLSSARRATELRSCLDKTQIVRVTGFEWASWFLYNPVPLNASRRDRAKAKDSAEQMVAHIPRGAPAASGFRMAQRVPMMLGGKNVSCVKSRLRRSFSRDRGVATDSIVESLEQHARVPIAARVRISPGRVCSKLPTARRRIPPDRFAVMQALGLSSYRLFCASRYTTNA